MDGGGAYGAGKAGEAFHLVEFLKRPRTIARILSWLFALIVFACIISETQHESECIFGQDQNACHFGEAIGIMGFIVTICFFVSDLIFPSISSAEKRKKIVIADVIVSGIFTFLFFVCFCYLTNTWAKRDSTDFGVNNAQAAIAFSFFSILSWAGLTYLAVQSYRQGTLSAFAPTYADPAAESSAPYSSFPGPGDMTSPSYQQGPFMPSGEASFPPTSGGQSDYQPPKY